MIETHHKTSVCQAFSNLVDSRFWLTSIQISEKTVHKDRQYFLLFDLLEFVRQGMTIINFIQKIFLIKRNSINIDQRTERLDIFSNKAFNASSPCAMPTNHLFKALLIFNTVTVLLRSAT